MDRGDVRSDLFAMLLRIQFAHSQFGRRQQHTRGGIGRVLEPFIGAEHTNQHLHLVIVGGDIIITDWPVKTRPKPRTRLEIIGTIAKRNSAPVIRASTHHALPPPAELARSVLVRIRVRLTRNVPTAVDGAIVEPVLLVRRLFTTQGRVARQLQHCHLALHIKGAPRL